MLAPGTRLGPYEIITRIGEGGMGVVWRATDTTLGRQVAVKVLPDAVAQDGERLARLQREARTLAALNHPNIAAIHGFERSGDTHALVMELVEGPTLADRIAQGAIIVDEALPIARQIAEALEAAHERGIVHRDLKPANIKVRPDGTVKVLDFGLAKALEPAGAPSPASTQSPTITTPAMTQAGMIMGTAAYMSPEQARGKPVDKRADIWAFGCVLYEMLTGRRAFEAEDVSLTLAEVMKSDPDLGALPEEVPARVRQTVRACLQKDPRQRIGDAQSLRLALEGAFDAVPTQRGRPDEGGLARRRVVLLGVAAAAVAALCAGAAVWYATRAEPPAIVRTEVATVPDEALFPSGADRDLAITPDGSRIVYRRLGGLLVRALDQFTPTAITGLGNPRGIFVSPDGQWVGYFDGTTLAKVAVTGGPPVRVTAVLGNSRGAAWGGDGTIVFATTRVGVGLERVSSTGGEPTVLTTPDGAVDHFWPEFLPGGRAVLFTIWPESGNFDEAQVAVLDLRTNTQTVLVRGGHHGHYVPTGHLIYGSAGTMRAVAFDVERLAVAGTPAPVLQDVLTTSAGGVGIAVAGDGTMVFVPGGLPDALQRAVLWVDREGRAERLGIDAGTYVYPRISPDGTRAVFDARTPQRNLWVWDFAREIRSRLTIGDTGGEYPVWTTDSARIAYGDNTGDIYAKAANNTGSATLLLKSPGRPGSGTPDPYFFAPGEAGLVFRESHPESGDNIGLAPLRPDAQPVWLLSEPFNERNAELSPNGRWMAYESDESGRFEIYVRPFPNVNDDRIQVSNAGGVMPLWSRDGRELFYIEPGEPLPTLMTTSVVSDAPRFSAGSRMRLFTWSYRAGLIGTPGRSYDVSPDGRRFLVLEDVGNDEAAAPRLVVVQNFFEDLKRLVPVN